MSDQPPSESQGVEPVEPYIPATTSLAEITLKALILGGLLSILLAGANAYLGLLAGMTVSASIPAAVISMAVLRMFRKSNVLENNIVQTAASAGESLAAGVIFTFPALIILNVWTDFDYWQTTTIAALGGIIGVLFTIPLRRALVVESPLKFPEGVATAEVLKVGDQGGEGVRSLTMGGLIGALFKFGQGGLGLWTQSIEYGRRAGTSVAYVGTELLPALLAVGYIVGINIAVLVFLGGALNWFVAIPIVAAGEESWPRWTERPPTQVVEFYRVTETMSEADRTEAETVNARQRDRIGAGSDALIESPYQTIVVEFVRITEDLPPAPDRQAATTFNATQREKVWQQSDALYNLHGEEDPAYDTYLVEFVVLGDLTGEERVAARAWNEAQVERIDMQETALWRPEWPTFRVEFRVTDGLEGETLADAEAFNERQHAAVDRQAPSMWEAPWNAFHVQSPHIHRKMIAAERAAAVEAIAAAGGRLGQPVDAVDWAKRIWSRRTRYLGVGAMLVGGLWALLRLWRSLIAGVSSGFRAYRESRDGNADDVPRTQRDTPMQWVAIALVLSVVPVFLVFQNATGNLGVSMFMAVAMLVAGFLFAAVASYMAGLVGSSNNPISGVTIATLLTSALLLAALGTDSATGPAAAILIGAVVCCACAIGGDNMQDLKAGQLLGATPYKQQIMQGVGVVAAAFVMAPILSLLLNAYGIAIPTADHPEPLAAPQATLMASVAEGVFTRSLPWDLVATGMLVAVAIIILDLFLEKKGTAFRTPVLAVAVGIYLPIELSVPILFGGLISLAAHRWHMRRISSEASGELQSSLIEAKEKAGRRGLLFAAGLITGEAIIGILLAIPIVANEGVNPLDLSGDGSVLPASITAHLPNEWPGVVLLLLVMVVLYRLARGK